MQPTTLAQKSAETMEISIGNQWGAQADQAFTYHCPKEGKWPHLIRHFPHQKKMGVK
jgi:hypothetical protein